MKILIWGTFFFFIRNEEEYINIRTNTGEKKRDKKKRKKPREGWEVLPTQIEQRIKLPIIEL